VVAATVAALPVDDDRIITIINVTNKNTRATATSSRHGYRANVGRLPIFRRLL